MQKVKLFATGEVVEVSNNEAHTLIDGKKGELWHPEVKQYENRQMTTGRVGKLAPKRFYKSKKG